MSEGLARPLTAEDYIGLCDVISKRLTHYQRRTGRSFMHHIKPDVVLDNLMRGVVTGHMVGGILVCYQMGSPWYTDETILQECLCLRLRPGGSFADVPVWLEQEARAKGCIAVTAGTALSTGSKALSGYYEAAGFSVQSHELYKELV
jgi:hypothetical protein